MAVKPVPDGFHTVTPYLNVKDADRFIEFCKQAFDATVRHCITMPDGAILNAEILIGNSIVMLAELREDTTPSRSSFYIYTEDTDSWYKNALAAGAESLMEPAEQVYGDINAGVKDKFGIEWWIATHVKDVSAEEIEKHFSQSA